MTRPTPVTFRISDIDDIAAIDGVLALLVAPDGTLDALGRRVNRLSKGAVKRLVDSDQWDKIDEGSNTVLRFLPGLAAHSVLVAKLPRRVSVPDARRAGAKMATVLAGEDATLLAGSHPKATAIAFGLVVRSYAFDDHKSKESDVVTSLGVMVNDIEAATAAFATAQAQINGVFFTRDLTNEPANVLTTVEFAERLKDLDKLGVVVEVLDEPALEKLGMQSLLAVGFGSETPSKVVVMTWNGGGDEAPLALVGKGVVFDTGGISLKPAGGMEDMTMDMGGAGVVSGVMRTLAERNAKANVVGLVGLVENMPDGRAQRPGDVVRSMKGDTIEVINTDAEGRLVLCDVLWYAQQKFKPAAIVDLATLTGAVIIALGHEKAGVFSNNDDFARKFLKAAAQEDEGAWHMPLDKNYAKQLKSRVADVKNVGGRPAGSVTAAEFLHRFVEDDVPWIHLDIAGVASRSDGTDFAPKGATGWGVLALDRLVSDHFETDD